MKTIDKIINKGKVGLVGLGLLGLVNCTASQESALLGFVLQGAAINNPNLTPQQAATAGAASQLLYNQSQVEGMKEAAREGKSEVNVHVNVPQQRYHQQKSEHQKQYPMVFTYDKKEKKIGKQIYHSGEEIEIWGVLANKFPYDSLVANENIHIKTGKNFFVIKKDKGIPIKVGELGTDEGILGIFKADTLIKVSGEGEFENVWYVQLDGKWKEIGRVRYAVFK